MRNSQSSQSDTFDSTKSIDIGVQMQKRRKSEVFYNEVSFYKTFVR